MKRITVPILASTAAVILSGCMHTVVGGNPDVSPDKKYALGIEIYGASGKAYTAKTKKRVYLWVATNGSHEKSMTLLDKKYVFSAADLGCNVHWNTPEEVSVVFFDYGDGIYAGDARKSSTPSNYVASLVFHHDSKTGRFIETK